MPRESLIATRPSTTLTPRQRRAQPPDNVCPAELDPSRWHPDAGDHAFSRPAAEHLLREVRPRERLNNLPSGEQLITPFVT